jgi:hypothetical protein
MKYFVDVNSIQLLTGTFSLTKLMYCMIMLPSKIDNIYNSVYLSVFRCCDKILKIIKLTEESLILLQGFRGFILCLTGPLAFVPKSKQCIIVEEWDGGNCSPPSVQQRGGWLGSDHPLQGQTPSGLTSFLCALGPNSFINS